MNALHYGRLWWRGCSLWKARKQKVSHKKKKEYKTYISTLDLTTSSYFCSQPAVWTPHRSEQEKKPKFVSGHLSALLLEPLQMLSPHLDLTSATASFKVRHPDLNLQNISNTSRTAALQSPNHSCPWEPTLAPCNTKHLILTQSYHSQCPQ